MFVFSLKLQKFAKCRIAVYSGEIGSSLLLVKSPIHWIRPILENSNDARIWYFERANEENENQEYYWYESQDFLVILKQIEPDVLLLTSFYVDKDKKKQLKAWYQKYMGL